MTKNIYLTNNNQRKARMAVLTHLILAERSRSNGYINNRVDLLNKNIVSDKEVHFKLIKRNTFIW